MIRFPFEQLIKYYLSSRFFRLLECICVNRFSIDIFICSFLFLALLVVDFFSLLYFASIAFASHRTDQFLIGSFQRLFPFVPRKKEERMCAFQRDYSDYVNIDFWLNIPNYWSKLSLLRKSFSTLRTFGNN